MLQHLRISQNEKHYFRGEGIECNTKRIDISKNFLHLPYIEQAVEIFHSQNSLDYATMSVDMNTLYNIFQYELNSAERHRRYVSLMMIHSPIDQEGMEEALGIHGRDSDIMAQVDGSMAVLMGETDQNAALRAIDRYNPVLEEQYAPHYSLATYPSDDHKPDVLLEMAKQRLKRAKTGTEKGRVVFED